MTVYELARRISAREIREWMVFWQIEAEELKEAQQRAELEARAKQGVQQQISHPRGRAR